MEYYRNPITKEMIQVIKEDTEIGQKVSFRNDNEIRIGHVIEKYDAFMVLEYIVKGHTLRRTLKWIDYILENKEALEQ